MNDPALLCCGHMEVHVSLGTCGPLAFRQLAKNYLGLDAHLLFEAADGCVKSGRARINLGVGGGNRDQLAEFYTSCDDQTMKMRLSSYKVADNIPAIGNPAVGYNANYGNPKSCREWENAPIAPRL
ncbi:hypothetical protein TB2_034735 [Malus domestica]